MKKIEAPFIKRLLRISGQAFANLLSVQFWSSLIILSLSLTHSWTPRIFFEHSSLRVRKEKQARGKEGNEGSRKEKKDQVASAKILAGNLLHV